MSDIEYKDGFTVIGEMREIAITVAEGVQAPNQVFVMQFGSQAAKDKDGKPKPLVGRYALSRNIIKDGAATWHTVYGPDPAKLIDNAMMIVYGQLNIPLDQVFSDADLEDEWFTQKIEVVKDDVWKMPQYEDQLESFAEARGAIEEVLETAESNAVTTQEDYLKVAQILTGLRDNVNGDMKLLKSIVMGGDDAGNMPRIAKLGRGDNALREAMWLAELSDGEMQILPVTITSGKAGHRHVTRSLQEIAGTSYSIEVTFEDYEVGEDIDALNVPTPESVGQMLRNIAKRAFGIDEAVAKADGEFTTSLGDLAMLVDEAALAKAVDFRAKYGKHADTYDKDQYKEALTAFGATRCSTAGAVNLFEDAVEKLQAAVDSDDYAGKINSLMGTRGNLLIRHAASNARTMIDQNQKAVAIKDTLAETDVDKIDTVSVKEMNALAKAAYHYKLIAAYADAGDVWAELRGLAANKALENAKPIKAD